MNDHDRDRNAEVRRGRFAPTPSSLLHIGNAFTALLAWLHVRSCGGTFIVRVEDIDRPRSRPEYTERIVEDLHWLGLDWDEGPDVGGSYGPYVQSERQHLYEQAIERLMQKDCLYPCFCSRKEIMAAASAPHGLSSEGPAYTGVCKTMTEHERKLRRQTKHPSIRFAVSDQSISFHDEAAGIRSYPPGFGGDFIVKRADGIFAYQLAVVVDDHEMEMTDILRGSDLLDSTPRQIWLYQALGYNVPRFTHVPLLLDSDGRRLSKRNGSISLAEIRKRGVKAEQLVGMLAYWGGQLDKPEPVQPKDLIHSFHIANIPLQPILLHKTILKKFDL